MRHQNDLRRYMHKILIQQKCVNKMKGRRDDFDKSNTIREIEIIYKKMSVIILCVNDKLSK